MWYLLIAFFFFSFLPTELPRDVSKLYGFTVLLAALRLVWPAYQRHCENTTFTGSVNSINPQESNKNAVASRFNKDMLSAQCNLIMCLMPSGITGI